MDFAGKAVDTAVGVTVDFEVEVLIAGAAPTGLLLANELGLAGVRAAVARPAPSGKTAWGCQFASAPRDQTEARAPFLGAVPLATALPTIGTLAGLSGAVAAAIALLQH
jgi:hypothetical protein